MESKKDTNSEEPQAQREVDDVDTDDSDVVSFTSFDDDVLEDTGSRKKKTSTRRTRQTERMAAQQARKQEIQSYVQQIEQVLDPDSSPKKTDIADILTLIRQLLKNVEDKGNLRPLLLTKRPLDYRLAWAGSDDAVCHMCSGLHKVALARLQEVFMTFSGRNRVQVQEVIRVFGPFPNVKNILQGEASYQRQGDDDVMDWKVTWDSMIDGTGKEILAGKEENIRIVDMQVYFADPSILIAVVPPSAEHLAERRADPLENSGENALVFLREDDLESKLESMRVA